MSTSLTLGHVTVGIITALPTELAAVREVFSPAKTASGPSGTMYDLYEVPCVNGIIIVAVTLLPVMGNNLATAVTTLMKRDCENIRHVMMVGVAGAIPSPANPEAHVRLGDIVVSGIHGVFQFDAGKQVSRKSFIYSSVPARPSALLINALNRLLAEECRNNRPWETLITQVCALHPEFERPNPDTDIFDDGHGPIIHPDDLKRREGFPRLFVGMIASSNIVLKNAAKRNKLVKDLCKDGRSLYCIEMEGSGVQDASWLGEIGYFIIRGTCDYCNFKKNKQWQPYAALIAAAFARSIVEDLAALPLASSALTGPPDSSVSPLQSFGKISSQSDMPVIHILGGSVSFNIGAMSGSTFSVALSSEDIPDLGSKIKPETFGTQSMAAMEAARLLQQIRDALKVWNYEQAEKAATEFESLVTSNGKNLNEEVLLEGTLLLARVYVNRAELMGSGAGQYVSRAKEQLKRAEGMRGCSAVECLAEMTALTVSLESLEKGADAGLALLLGRNDPYAIRTRIVLLLNKQRFPEAMAVIDGLEPHERWCDVAVPIYALNGQLEKAQSLFNGLLGCRTGAAICNVACVLPKRCSHVRLLDTRKGWRFFLLPSLRRSERTLPPS